jgi:hypothetical protein
MKIVSFSLDWKALRKEQDHKLKIILKERSRGVIKNDSEIKC